MTDPGNSGVSLTSQALNYLKESSGWGSFLAIVGFCYVGVLIVLGLFAGSLMSSLAGDDEMAGGMTTVLLSAFYICMAIIYLFPCLYLFRFSQEMKTAIARNSTEGITLALQNLKSLFKFIGIFTGVGIVLFALAMAVIGSGALF